MVTFCLQIHLAWQAVPNMIMHFLRVSLADCFSFQRMDFASPSLSSFHKSLMTKHLLVFANSAFSHDMESHCLSLLYKGSEAKWSSHNRSLGSCLFLSSPFTRAWRLGVQHVLLVDLEAEQIYVSIIALFILIRLTKSIFYFIKQFPSSQREKYNINLKRTLAVEDNLDKSHVVCPSMNPVTSIFWEMYQKCSILGFNLIN